MLQKILKVKLLTTNNTFGVESERNKPKKERGYSENEKDIEWCPFLIFKKL